MIDKGVNVEARNLLEYFRFHDAKSFDQALALLDWMASCTYRFEEVSYAPKMSFSYFCVSHALSFFEKQFVEPCVPFPSIFDYVPWTGLVYYS